VVPNITGATGTIAEDKLLEKSMDLIFAFDEVNHLHGFKNIIITTLMSSLRLLQ
jgi:hypothetical protein